MSAASTDVRPPAARMDGSTAHEDRLLPAVLRSEWTKLRSVRSTMWALLATIGITIGFGSLAVASTIVYGVALANEPPPVPPRAPPAPPDHRAEAWTLTQQAQSAARTGDCATVATLDHQVAELDASFHDAVFARDVAISRCTTR